MAYKKWTRRGCNESILAAVEDLSKMNKQELVAPKDTPPEDIEGMVEAAARIKNAIKQKEPITIFGDYDADGVCSLAILFLLFKYFEVTPTIRVPKRISEGYGVSEAFIDEVPAGLLITVDNGIAAIKAIKKAKDKGLSVIVLDHHLPGDELPAADILIDPHVHPNKNGYEDFCGGGLSYKLAQMLLPKAENILLSKLSAMAAIATIADVVPLTGANRVIVQEGLQAINRREVTAGLKGLLEACQFTTVNEENIAFKLAPVLNAAGRLLDDGARYSSGCLAQDSKPVPALAAKLLETNTKRKEIVEAAYQRILERVGDIQEAPLVVCDASLHEGVVGIVAGKLAEQYNMPAFVFSGEGHELHGSGRSAGGVHLRDLAAKASDLLIQFGGHAGAVGLTIEKDNISAFLKRLQDEIKEFSFSDPDELLYDVVISQEEVCGAIQELAQYAPYGEHNPKPVFLVQDIELFQRFGLYAKYLGKNGEHVKLTALGYSLVGFGLSERYKMLGEPTTVDVVGRLGMNESIFGSFPQVEIIDIRPAG